MATNTAAAIQNVRDGLQAQKRFAYVWAECDNFLRSEQNLYRTPDGRLIESSKIPAIQRKIRNVYNIISSRFIREVSAFTGQFPGWQVDPSPPVGTSSGEMEYESAQAAAVAAERQLGSDYESLHLGRATARAKWLACEFGEGYLWAMFDSSKGQPIGQTGKNTGENVVKVLDPTQVVWRKGRHFEDSDFHAVRCTYTREEVAARYPNVAPETIVPDAISQENLSDALIDNGSNAPDLVTLWEYFERPSTANPKGLHLILMGEQEISRDDYPYIFEETNNEPWLIRYVYIQPERSSRAKGLVQDMLDVQRAFNRRMNLLSEWAGIAANPMPVLNKRAADTQRRAVYPGKTWISEPAFDGGRPVTFTDVPGLPTWLSDSPQELTRIMDTITGQYDLNNVASTAAAATVQQIIDQNTSSRGEVARGFNDADSRLAIRLLLLARKYYTEPRTLHYRGETGESELRGFVASRELPKRINVRVTTGAPKTADQNAQLISNWMAAGWVPPPIGILAIQRNQPELVTRRYDKNIEKQQRENDYIMKLNPQELESILQQHAQIDVAFKAAGVDISQAPPPPGPWPMPNEFDDNAVHMRVMEDWFLTQEYELLPDTIKQAAIWHYQAHKEQEKENMMKQQDEQNQMAAMLGMGNASKPPTDKIMPSQPSVPSAEGQDSSTADQQPVER